MKSKPYIILLAILISMTLTACSNVNSKPSSKKQREIQEKSSSSESISTLSEGSFKGYSFLYDSTWRTRISDNEEFIYLYPTDNDADGFVMLNYTESEVISESGTTQLFFENMTNNDNVTEIKENSETKLKGNYARKVLFKQLINETEYEIESYIIPHGNNGIMYIAYCVPSNNTDKYYDGFFEILNTLEESNSSESYTTDNAKSTSEKESMADKERLEEKLSATEAWGAVLSYGESQYLYGFKLNLVLGRIAEEASDEDTWFLKSACEVTNEYGATAEMTCEAYVTGTNGNPQVIGFNVY